MRKDILLTILQKENCIHVEVITVNSKTIIHTQTHAHGHSHTHTHTRTHTHTHTHIQTDMH